MTDLVTELAALVEKVEKSRGTFSIETGRLASLGHFVSEHIGKILKWKADLDAAEARIAELEDVVKAYQRVLFPITMTLAERECVDDPANDSDILFSFMGSGASDRVTVGEFRAADTRARTALGENRDADR